MSLTQQAKRPIALAVFFIVAGIIGFYAAFELTLDKFAVAANPNAQLSCNVSVLVGCSKNLLSWQGSLLGFPNPILGLSGWTAAIAMGAAIFAAPRLERWFWLLFNLGVVGALALVIFLIYTSVAVLDVLCPFCMLTWSVTIPTFWAITLYNLKEGHIPVPESIRKRARFFYSWVPLITLCSYVVVAVIAQVQLDWLHRL